MSNTVSTKRINAIFLAIVLVLGIITLASPSFMTAGITQAQPYYDGMDSDRKSYESNSYDSTDYEIDKDRKAYGTDSYKPKYSSDVKDDKRDKSKDSKVDINKLKCINDNLNINGENTGNVSIGNKGAAADRGYVGGGYSSVDGSEGYGSGDGYYNDGYNKNKKDNGFDCIINNNNTNANIGGNATDGNGNETLTCEECFERFLTPTELTASDELLIGTLETYCDLIGAGDVEEDDLRATLVMVIGQGQEDRIDSIINCLLEIGVVFAPPT